MAIRMAKLTRAKTGLWTSRKVIPEDVRQAFGKREDKPTWPASLSANEARQKFTFWLAELESKIADFRSASEAPETSISEREAWALAGKWYRKLIDEYGENPGDALGWEVSKDELRPDDSEDEWRSDMFGLTSPDAPIRYRPTSFVMTECDELLIAERLRVPAHSREKLLQILCEAYAGFCNEMIKRAQGDYSADRFVSRFPDWGPAKEAPKAVHRSATVSLQRLLDGYLAERKPAPATEKVWRRHVAHLIAFLGHDDAAQVQPKDMVAWKDRLLSEPKKDGSTRSPKTVRETYLVAARLVFQWGVENHLIAENPAASIKVRGAKRIKLRDPGFTDEEAKTILTAALKEQSSSLQRGHALARRWVPWLCAYTGARVNEMTQLRGKDVYQRDGIWVLNITPEAGSVKSGKARLVPLHPHLIELGFPEVAESIGEGPIFYDPKLHRGGSEGNPQFKKVGERLAKWVRALGVDDPNVQPNHGWRHRFKTIAREAGLDHEAREAICGHAPATQGEEYGVWSVSALNAQISKLPRYSGAMTEEQ